MPPNNRFRHQEYLSVPRTSSVRRRRAPDDTPRADSDAFRRDLERAGELFRAAGVGQCWLVHGTFVGDDPLGVWRQCERLGLPTRLGRRAFKRGLDAIVRDLGNFTAAYADELAAGLRGRRLADLAGDVLQLDVPPGDASRESPSDANESPGPARDANARDPGVRRWVWSSQNNHVGRAAAALRFVVDLDRHAPRDGRRLVVWGHSHGGNVLALVSNLLTAPSDSLEAFCDALRPEYERIGGRMPDEATWRLARELLSDAERREQLRRIPLDVVTFGTPIRYGWDSGGYARLLHVVHHRPDGVRPRRERGLPFRLLDAWSAREGDYVQRIGIAGTNFAPCPVFRRRSRRADRNLHAVIQAGVTSRGLFERLRPALRTADEGPTLAIDYGPQRFGPLGHLLGHGVYTRRRWMSFHALLAGEWLNEADESASPGDA